MVDDGTEFYLNVYYFKIVYTDCVSDNSENA